MSSPQKIKSGIYKIENTGTGEFYIGSAKNVKKRFVDHLYKLRNNIHANKILQNIYNKYGEEIFHFDIVEFCVENKLIFREQFYIDSLKPVYNICKIAGNKLGFKLSEETKKKIGNSNKGKNLGKIPWNKGKTLSDETKKKISRSLIGKPAHGRPKGTPQTEEWRKQQSLRLTGITRSVETREKMSLASKKRWKDGVYAKRNET